MTTWQIEPLGPWNRPVTVNRASVARFRVMPGHRRIDPTWPEVRDGLVDEIDRLSPASVIAIRLDLRDATRAGLPKAGAFPGVAVSFTTPELGSLTYATDNFETWWANVRAIALSLEALRAVDRYGVTRSGEQYVGWRQIEATPPAPFSDADGALRWLRERMNAPVDQWPDVARLVRTARRDMHPDRAGDRAQWDLLEQAVTLMTAGGLL